MEKKPDMKLQELLQPKRLTSIVHVGASKMEQPPWYTGMVKAERLATVIGFDPQDNMPDRSDLETYLPYAVFDGLPQTFHHCVHPGLSSIYEPDVAAMELFSELKDWGKVTRTDLIETRRLDDIVEVEMMDYLVIDAQGAEFVILDNARRKLEQAAAVQVEMGLISLYKEQPMFSDIDVLLRHLGFVPHTFVGQARHGIMPYDNSKLELTLKVNQSSSVDLLYVKDFAKLDRLDNEQIKHMAMVVYYCFQSFDLAYRCADHLRKRGAIARPAPRVQAA